MVGWEHHRDLRRRWPIAKGAVGSPRIIVPTPVFNQDLHLKQVVENLPVEQLVTQLAVEAFNECVNLIDIDRKE
jgi:hypothetical protein